MIRAFTIVSSAVGALAVAFIVTPLQTSRIVETAVRNADATPLYMARSGRTCDNCHTDPTGWKNPSLPWRKCSLACLGCHVNPTGGGLRTVSGRFYGQSTLPMFFASHRPYKDRNRHLIRHIADKKRKNYLPEPALWSPLGGTSRLAYDENRYAGLRADPLILAGIDLRTAFWFPEGSTLVFPMQLDTHLAIHPLPYVTAFATAGVLGKSQGFVQTFRLGCRPDDPNSNCQGRAHGTPFMVKDVFLMAHQLPMMSYLRVGRFVPTFGTLFDDHTLSTRRQFELDQGLLHSRVTGVELGMAPNYAYFHLSIFRPNQQDRFVDNPSPVSPDELPPFFGVDGVGIATSFGWRDLGWQVGASGMMRSRDLADGGDTLSLALSWSFNPWFYLDALPLTYLGEFAIGQRQRLGSGTKTGQVAMVHELDYLVVNGINLRVRYDFGDFDTVVLSDHYHRFSFGGDWIALPGISVTGMARMRTASGPKAQAAVDGFLFLRAWY